MKLDRLFNVLVLGGAALATGCSGGPPVPPVDRAAPTGDGGASEGAPPDAAPPPDARDAEVDAGRGDAASAPDADGGCALACVDLGFPCCWLGGDCRTDPTCAEKLCK